MAVQLAHGVADSQRLAAVEAAAGAESEPDPDADGRAPVYEVESEQELMDFLGTDPECLTAFEGARDITLDTETASLAFSETLEQVDPTSPASLAPFATASHTLAAAYAESAGAYTTLVPLTIPVVSTAATIEAAEYTALATLMGDFANTAGAYSSGPSSETADAFNVASEAFYAAMGAPDLAIGTTYAEVDALEAPLDACL